MVAAQAAQAAAQVQEARAPQAALELVGEGKGLVVVALLQVLQRQVLQQEQQLEVASLTHTALVAQLWLVLEHPDTDT